MKLPVIGLVAIAVGFSGFMLFSSRSAPTPEAFRDAPRLGEAIERAAAEDRAVVAVATADWCGPCQKLKRDTLSDERIEALIAEKAIPVYLDDAVDRDVIGQLGVTAYPTTLVIRGGEIVARSSGYMPPEAYRAFLAGAIDAEG